MKAVVLSSIGNPEVLQRREVAPPPLTRPHDMRVRIKAAGVNPLDTKLRKRGTYYPDVFPVILGCDGAGVVESVGAAVTRFRPGDAVYFCNGGIGGEPGTYAEYTIVNEHYAAHKPASLDFFQAAAVPLALITAWESLHDRAQISAGDEVLIHAGAGGVGHLAIQLAHLAGARVVTTVSNDQKAEFTRGLGAARAILYRASDFVAEVAAWSRDGGVRVALDTVGGDTLAKTFEAMRCYGDLVTLLQPDANTNWKVAREKNLRIAFELMLTPIFKQLHDARLRQVEILEQGAGLFDAGQLRIAVAEILPLRDAARAHHLIETGGMTGKIVLDVGEEK